MDAHAARALVQRGGLRGRALREVLGQLHPYERERWVDVLLDVRETAFEEEALPQGLVPYLPAGVDELLALVARVEMSERDTFVDIGAGLGRAGMLVHLLTGAAVRGVEWQGALVREARRASEALGLVNVAWEHGDARERLPDGDVYFLYSPMNGAALQTVVEALEQRAAVRTRVVCTLGFELHARWLCAREQGHVSLHVYDTCERAMM